MGNFHHPISTRSKAAQQFFDQGLVLFYGFEWNESIRAFQEAVRLDNRCAMCQWGLALALMTKSNAPLTGHEVKDARDAMTRALRLMPFASAEEQGYIQALAPLVQAPAFKSAVTSLLVGLITCHASDAEANSVISVPMQRYAFAMGQLSEQYPNDSDAKTLFAFALFNSIGWQAWDVNGKMNFYTPTILHALETVLKKNPEHPGANHYYIHVLERSSFPEKALPNAIRLANLVPGAEHLVHMPAHIYFLTGQYHAASLANLRAIDTYKKYVQTCHQQGFEPAPTYFYLHNFDFLRSSASMEGNQQLALEAVHELQKNISDDAIKLQPALETYRPTTYFVEARFSLWDTILNEPKPNNHFYYALGFWHYARGLAFLHKRNLLAADQELQQLQTILNMKTSATHFNAQGVKLLTIAKEVLMANQADVRQDEAQMVSHLKLALNLQQSLGYQEPPGWYFSISDALKNAELKWHVMRRTA